MMDCDFMPAYECFELRQNTKYYTDVYILEASPPYHKFDVLSNSQISRKKEFSDLHKDIKKHRSTLYTSDLSTLISENGFDVSFINMSTEYRSKFPFNDSDIITVDDVSVGLFAFFDYQPESKEIIATANEFVEGQHAYSKVKSSSLLALNPSTLSEDTLLTFDSELNDSLFIEKDISRIIYSSYQQLIIFELNKTTYYIDTPNQKPDDWEKGQIESSLYTLNKNNELNLFYTFDKRIYNHYNWMQVTDDYLIYKDDSLLYLINFDGTLTKTMWGHTPKSYSGINSFTYNEGINYYNIDENYSLDLSQYVENISSANPSQDVILITESDTKLHLFSIPDKKIIQTITLSDLPSINYKKDNINYLGLYHPILTSENKLRLIYIHNYYYDDQNDDCEI